MLSVFQQLKLLRRLYEVVKEAREVHVAQTMPKPSHWHGRISCYGWMGITDMHNDSFLDNFTSGSCSSASRSDLFKLPNNSETTSLLFFILQALRKCWCSIQTISWLWEDKKASTHFTWEEESISSTGTQMGIQLICLPNILFHFCGTFEWNIA